MKRTIQYGGKRISFVLEYFPRKSLGITVTPEMEVIVKAPTATPTRRVEEIMVKRASWIIRQQRYFLAFYPRQVPRKYVSGETHLYLGRQYRLKVRVGSDESVRLKGGYIEVVCKTKRKVKFLLQQWYRQLAVKKFDECARTWIELFCTHYHIVPPAIEMRRMEKRWGSCIAGKKIVLNPELVKAPRGCIEYVIVHELCHLVHRNHNRKFIDLQTRMMPHWEKWKYRLETLLA